MGKGFEVEKENVVKDKSYKFAVRIVKACQYLVKEKKEYVLSRQLLKSGTSIGANIEEAIGGQSRRDFFAKLTISYKEARETRYWIRLLRDTEYFDITTADSLLKDINELLKILSRILKTMKDGRGVNY